VLMSMTGFGEARRQDDRATITVEVRSVNNRHFKLSTRLSDPYDSLEPEVERLVRESVRRGTVQLSMRVERPRQAEDYRLNVVALASYRDQLRALDPDGREPALAAVLGLPGVVEDRRPPAGDPRDDWSTLSAVVVEALRQHRDSRADEGRAMATELLALGAAIADRLAAIADRAPEVVAGYQSRLIDRVRALIESQGVAIEPRDLVREVAIFAERADVAEEVVRLRSHLDGFRSAIDEPESSGRKLEFLVQEMGREVNTIGSKANDLAIGREVVEIKGALEKIRELIQNVE